MRRFIPKRTYQIIALATLLIPVGIWLSWVTRWAGPLPWLHRVLAFFGERESRLLAAVLAFFLPFGAWVLAILPLRAHAQLPTPQEEMARLGAASRWELFTRAYQEEQRTQSEMLARPAADPARQRHFRRMGGIGIGVGALALLVTGSVAYATGRLWLMGLAVGIVGLLGGALSLLTGRAFIFNGGAVQRVDRVVRVGGGVLVLLILLALAFLCVGEAFIDVVRGNI